MLATMAYCVNKSLFEGISCMRSKGKGKEADIVDQP